ncbi:MAG: hypothetical protein AAGI48_01635 [Verrucomicrobiota bacterium]
MILSDEFRTQAIIAALQCTLIIAGSMMVATMMKSMGYPEASYDSRPLLLFIRSWGFLLILIPLAWVLITIYLERRSSEGFTKRWTIASGVFLFILLLGFFMGAVGQAGSRLIQSNS